METKHQKMQAFIRHYKNKTNEKEVDMHKVADMAAKMGWKLPKPATALDLLAREFSKAAREETRVDNVTGQPYRVNHAYKADSNGNLVLWIDIDEAPRGPMLKSAINRREQVVGDLVQLTLDLDHWNRVNPAEDPIEMENDFTEDVQWRLNGGDAQEDVA
ncbi:hypothetical protein HNR46_001624 [Haloferula luteola]|uniref:Uncharacterized protein n=1 Tax=Haloferula luteola TaxID=595692 RepID=A0A840V9L5_9BACT|nr:hypothetical protein [Haloferula luteola]MBB5351388.1 hypothetical protein [Haloferula luteola]